MYSNFTKAFLLFLFFANINYSALGIRTPPPHGDYLVYSDSGCYNENVGNERRRDVEEFCNRGWGVILDESNPVCYIDSGMDFYSLIVNNQISYYGVMDCRGLGYGGGDNDSGQLRIDGITFGWGNYLIFDNYSAGAILFRGHDLSRLAFRDSFGILYKATGYDAGEGYVRIYSSCELFTPPPTPEPSTYGAVVSVCVLGVGFWRKRKSRLKQSLKKPLGGGDAQAT